MAGRQGYTTTVKREKIGYKGERERKVLMAEGSTRGRGLTFGLANSFLFIFVGQYTIVKEEITTLEYCL
jgi:hypothetical protein